MIRGAVKTIKWNLVKWSLLTIFVSILFMDRPAEAVTVHRDLWTVTIGGCEVGTVADPADFAPVLRQARRALAAENEGMVFLKAEPEYSHIEGTGFPDGEEVLKDRTKETLKACVITDLQPSYAVKIGDFLVYLSSAEEVRQLLQAALDKYEPEGNFRVGLVRDADRTLRTLTSRVEKREEAVTTASSLLPASGVSAEIMAEKAAEIPAEQMDFGDFDLGVLDIDFSRRVEVTEGYAGSSQILSLETAVAEATLEEAVPDIYVVQPGDTLSQIAEKVNIPMDRLVELNPEKLESTASVIRVDDRLTITVPEPALSVEWADLEYAEETYDADIVYVDRDDWYTTKTNVIRQPSAGFRRVIAESYYLNDRLQGREILKEEVVMEAIAKIVERGTIIPPTYIKPISGGRFSSGFGKRVSPTKGASTYHKGVDWATPTGTTVFASSGGTVSKAGWGNGYGYVVYIDHPDGRQTRYGHLSRILVSVGDKVSQGQTIALSGSTGVSTGPHIHFEILIDGKQVNPLNYLD
ncbi:MAG: M23 family metallopeptidase [Lachnospiraceae bacterium]|nr:M23 family metallopeptidase [Lachnospiraceae bacterium]